jgi:hypothetical protein
MARMNVEIWDCVDVGSCRDLLGDVCEEISFGQDLLPEL